MTAGQGSATKTRLTPGRRLPAEVGAELPGHGLQGALDSLTTEGRHRPAWPEMASCEVVGFLHRFLGLGLNFMPPGCQRYMQKFKNQMVYCETC